MRRIADFFSPALALGLLMLFPVKTFADIDAVKGISWSIDKVNYVLTISGNGPMDDYEWGYSPWYMNNFNVTTIINDGVTSIGECSFTKSALNKISIPHSVTRIGVSAFDECSNLTSIVIPSSVTSFECGFTSCTGLKSVVVEKGNPVYDSRDDCNAVIETATNTLLAGCSNTVIPQGVTSIGQWAFYGMTGIKNFELPEGVTVINNRAFMNCSYLTDIKLPETLKTICDSVFLNCLNLWYIVIPASVESIGKAVFSGYYKKIYCNAVEPPFCDEDSFTPEIYQTASLYVPKGTLELYRSAEGWRNFELISEVTEWSFDESTSTLTILGDGNMTDFDYNAHAPWYEIRENIKNVIISDGVLSIGKCAFYDCRNLVSVTIPHSVNHIGQSAFGNCVSLSAVDIPESVSGIDSWAFESCHSLTSIVLPDSVRYTGNSVFYDCIALKSITLSDGLMSLNDYLFENCQSLDEIVIPENVGFLGYGLFYGCNSLQTVSMPKNISSLAPYIFYGCTSLRDLNIPESVAEISEYAFYGCESLTSLELGNSVILSGTYIFGNCSGLQSFCIPSENVTVSEGLFANCGSLRSISIPNSIKTIGAYAFSGCGSLESLTIPASTVNIADNAFEGLKSLTQVEFMCPVVSNWFEGNDAIQTVVLGQSVSAVENSAFKDCSSLTSVIVTEQTISSIGEYAFVNTPWYDNQPGNVAYLGSLLLGYKGEPVDVIVNDTTVAIASGAFRNCVSLKSISIPNSVVRFGEEIFDGCVNLSDLYIDCENIDITGLTGSLSGLSKIVIGANVKTVARSFYTNDKVNEVYCLSVTPPNCKKRSFHPDVCESAVLYVPEESLEAYRNATGWQDFVNIQAIETTGISIVSSDGFSVIDNGVRIDCSVEGVPVNVYTTNGRLVSSCLSNNGSTTLSLPKGYIYVITISGKSYKLDMR